MSRSCYLRVAGITIHFEADRVIERSEAFLPFACGEAVPDLHVCIRMADQKPEIPRKLLYADRFCAAAKNEAGYLQKFFFENGKADSGCVTAEYDPDGRKVWIEYPASYAGTGLQLSSCFYWMGFEGWLLQKDKLCLHASLIDTHLGGILFSGTSGIGKSTQADLWCRYRDARQINGDRPILSRERDGWTAWGSPYAGSSRCYVNESSRVTAIILLKQAPVCKLRRLPPAEAFRGVWAGLTVRSWDYSFVDAASLLAMDLAAAVPVYEFCCTPDEEAVDFLEAELRRGCL